MYVGILEKNHGRFKNIMSVKIFIRPLFTFHNFPTN